MAGVAINEVAARLLEAPAPEPQEVRQCVVCRTVHTEGVPESSLCPKCLEFNEAQPAPRYLGISNG